METNATKQEILLVTGTTFSNREWCHKDGKVNNNFTEREQLEEACYNGLLEELLPEVFIQLPPEKRLFLWEIKQGNSFIELELGEIPGHPEQVFSIDPYSFMHLAMLS